MIFDYKPSAEISNTDHEECGSRAKTSAANSRINVAAENTVADVFCQSSPIIPAYLCSCLVTTEIFTVLKAIMCDLSFRPIQPSDHDFLRAVYASTRMEELSMTGWNDGQKAMFLAMQFSMQHQYYQQNYEDVEFLVVLSGNQPIGRLYIARWPEEIRIVDLALLPEFRNVGFGSKILEDVLCEAKSAGKPVTLHVERFNPALRLYQRLGFVKTGEQGVYDALEWPDSKL